MIEKKKLLYISNRVFWPPMGGHEVEIFHYCRGLHEKYEYEIDVFVFDDSHKAEPYERPSFLKNVFFADKISRKTQAINILLKSFLSSEKWPIQNSLYYSNSNALKISSLIKANQYDVVIVDMIRLATYYPALMNYDCKKILDIDDTLSKRYKRQLDAITGKTTIAGQYNDKLPEFLQKLLQASSVKKIVLKTEIPRMEMAEKRYSELFDRVIFVSPIETEEFNRKYKTDKAVTVGLGVDYPCFSEKISVRKCDGKVTFVGNMATPANADSVRYIIDQVLPHSKNIKSLVLVGNCPDSLREEYSSNSKVFFTGKVEDLRVDVEEGMVFLAPIAYGTGIKTKILEAMAMGLPVVTNSIGAEGIPGINGEQWYVSDDPQKIAEYTDELLLSQQKCDEIGERARAFVEKTYQWDIIFEQFNALNL
ncbi:glycosyltransferase [Beduinella massiliensis]|uniref:glycosyltransferase n=1 Tax=Beduinella massiliensis TaxID=1852363 RepID=UPI000C846366